MATTEAAPYPRTDGSQPCRQVDAEFFFPEKGNSADSGLVKRAIALCESCPFSDACFAYALTHNVSGIWGGTTHLARRQMRQNYGIAAIDPATGLDKLLGVSA